MLGGVGEERCRDHATPPSLAASGSSVNKPRRAALGRTQVNKPIVAGIDGGGKERYDTTEDSPSYRRSMCARVTLCRENVTGRSARGVQELTAAALRLRTSEKGEQEEKQRREEIARAVFFVLTAATVCGLAL
jgi:hypothetical protein